MKRWMMLMVAIALLVVPGTTFAGTDASIVEFDQMEGRLARGELRLDYTVDRRSWRALRELNVDARLNLWIKPSDANETYFAYSVELDRRRGRISFPRRVDVRNGDSVAIEVVGYAGAFRIESVRFEHQHGAWLTFDCHRGRFHAPGRERSHDDHRHDDDYGEDDHEHYAGCGHDGYERPRRGGDDHDHYCGCGHDGYEQPCERADRGDHEHDDGCGHAGYGHDQHGHSESHVDIINACEDAVFSSNVSKCVSAAKKVAGGFQSSTVRACEAAFIGDRDVLRCLGHARGHHWSPPETITACEEAFVGSSSTLSCIAKTRNANKRPAPLVQACGEAVIGERDTLACIDSSRM